MRLKLGWICSSVGLLLSSALLHVAWAVDMSVLSPCQDDMHKHCSQVEPGHGRMSLCLRRHEADLSPSCKARIDKIFEHVMEGREACGADAEKLCADVHGGHKPMIACLKRHRDELSASCKAEMAH